MTLATFPLDPVNPIFNLFPDWFAGVGEVAEFVVAVGYEDIILYLWFILQKIFVSKFFLFREKLQSQSSVEGMNVNSSSFTHLFGSPLYPPKK